MKRRRGAPACMAALSFGGYLTPRVVTGEPFAHEVGLVFHC